MKGALIPLLLQPATQKGSSMASIMASTCFLNEAVAFMFLTIIFKEIPYRTLSLSHNFCCHIARYTSDDKQTLNKNWQEKTNPRVPYGSTSLRKIAVARFHIDSKLTKIKILSIIAIKFS